MPGLGNAGPGPCVVLEMGGGENGGKLSSKGARRPVRRSYLRETWVYRGDKFLFSFIESTRANSLPDLRL